MPLDSFRPVFEKRIFFMKRILFFLSFFLLAACSRESPRASTEAPVPEKGSVSEKETALPSLSALSRRDAVVVPAPAPAPAATAEMTPAPGEPPEKVLQKLEFQRYEAIRKMGGVPVTVTATGRQLVLNPTLYSARKESCQPTPQAAVGWYECSLIIRVSLAADGSDPSEQGERIAVKWDGKLAEWVLQ
jgi:hypothetical protein